MYWHPSWHPSARVGAVPANLSYSANAKAAFSASGAGSIKAELSPVGQIALDLGVSAVGTVATEGVGGALLASAQVLTAAAQEVAINALSSSSDFAAAMPLVGTMISIVVMLANAQPATSNQCTPAAMKASCSTPFGELPGGYWNGGSLYQPQPVGTAPGGAYVPADLLVHDAIISPDGGYHVIPTSLATAIQRVTETVGVVGGGLADAKSHLGSYGLDEKRRKIYANLRSTIQLSWNRKGSDGGALAWLVYVDMLRADIEAGRLPVALQDYLWILDGGAMYAESYQLGTKLVPYNDDNKGAQVKRDIAAVYLTGKISWATDAGGGWYGAQAYAAEVLEDYCDSTYCGVWTDIPLGQLRSTVKAWKNTIDPVYSQFPSLRDQVDQLTKQLNGQFTGRVPLPKKSNLGSALLLGGAGGAALAFLNPVLGSAILKSTVGAGLAASKFALAAGKGAGAVAVKSAAGASHAVAGVGKVAAKVVGR